jgi:hypothetical protein
MLFKSVNTQGCSGKRASVAGEDKGIPGKISITLQRVQIKTKRVAVRAGGCYRNIC